jgi:ribosomal protein S18 acetylase RimI-like enzyme
MVGHLGIDRFHRGWIHNRGHLSWYPAANPRADYRQHVTTPLVTLRPITDPEFARWRDHAAASFAAGIGPAQGLGAAEALEFAYRETDRLLPQGRSTENHLIWLACAGDKPVGSLWINTRTRGAFIYGIEVDADHRGKGYGRAIMLAGEDECRRLGFSRMDLNVFGDNSTAIRLYESLGYAVTSQQMRKEL